MHAILDEGIIAHVAVVTDHGPVVLPMAYGRIGVTLYLHGAQANALLRAGERGVCVTVTLVDGLVLARSAMHHSANFRVVTAFGSLRHVTDAEEAVAALAAIVNHAIPGRSADCRPPSPSELRATRVVALELGECSAKVRFGGPVEDDIDLEAPYWSGVIPLAQTAAPPITADLPAGGGPVPASVQAFAGGRA